MKVGELAWPQGMTVYVDMDGVLADFEAGYHRLFGQMPSGESKDDPNIARLVGTDFFNTLPKYDTADALIQLVLDHAGRYSICTAPLRNDHKNSGHWKREWLAQHISPAPRQIKVNGQKEVYAVGADGVPNVLIDDKPKNIQRWRDAGGIAVEYYAPRDGLDVVAQGLRQAAQWQPDAVKESATGDLEKDLKDPLGYDAIDHMMQTISRRHGITADRLHDLFVAKHGCTPDHWIRKSTLVEKINPKVIEPGFTAEKWINGRYLMKAEARQVDDPKDNMRGLIIKVYDNEAKSYVAKSWGIGSVRFIAVQDKNTGEWSMSASMLQVNDQYQRQGIASAMYQWARELGNDIVPSGALTTQGKHFWHKGAGVGRDFANQPPVSKQAEPAASQPVKSRSLKDRLFGVIAEQGVAEGSEQDDKKIEIFQHLKQMPLTVFGSTVTKSFQEANDFDVFLDLDQNLTHKKFVRPVLNLARKYYGWIDPFVLKDGVLYVRNDDATAWTKAKNSLAILQQIRANGKSIDDIDLQGVAESLEVDVPNERWLQKKIDYAKRKGRTSYGVPYMGTTTAYTTQNTRVPMDILRQLLGMRGEQRNVRQDNLKALVKIMKDTGRLPMRQGQEYAPFINVAWNGEAWVNEGNHRIMAAAALGWKDLPVQIRYFDGGERVKSGVMYPGRIGLDSIDENFADGRGPGRPGDSKRHGIKKGVTLAQLDQIVHSKTASPRKKQLAHWAANMRRGKAKKK